NIRLCHIPCCLFFSYRTLGFSMYNLYSLSFHTGITIGAYYDTHDVNAAACVALAWGRILFIRVTLQSDQHENYITPLVGNVPFRWYFLYIFVLSLFHHSVLFMLETFTFHQFQYT